MRLVSTGRKKQTTGRAFRERRWLPIGSADVGSRGSIIFFIGGGPFFAVRRVQRPTFLLSGMGYDTAGTKVMPAKKQTEMIWKARLLRLFFFGGSYCNRRVKVLLSGVEHDPHRDTYLRKSLSPRSSDYAWSERDSSFHLCVCMYVRVRARRKNKSKF